MENIQELIKAVDNLTLAIRGLPWCALFLIVLNRLLICLRWK